MEGKYKIFALNMMISWFVEFGSGSITQQPYLLVEEYLRFLKEEIGMLNVLDLS